jgi:hypothetical protein
MPRNIKPKITYTSVWRSAVWLLRQGRRGVFVSESLAVGGGELVDKSPHKLARGGTQFAKAAIQAQQQRGRVVWIQGRKGVARGGGKPEGNQAQTKAK